MPAPKFGGSGGVENDPGKVKRSRLGISRNLVGPQMFLAPLTQLMQGATVGWAASEVADAKIRPVLR